MSTTAPSPYVGADQLVAMRAAVNYNRAIEHLLRKHLVDCEHVLDIGCGLGDFAARMRAVGHDVVCVEPDETQRSFVRERGLHCVSSVASCTQGSYDGIYSLNVLEHIEDDVAALREWFRVLRPGGMLLVYVPAFPVLYSAMDRAVGHHRRYTRKSLRETLKAAGFKVAGELYMDTLGFPASLALRLRGGNGQISARMVRFYDRVIFPLSLAFDPFFERVMGKNVWALAHKPKEVT